MEHPPPMELDADAARHWFGRMGFGCEHYKRRCRIRAPCCNDVFHCRHCHNQSTQDGHELDRHAVQSVTCLVCDTEQPIKRITGDQLNFSNGVSTINGLIKSMTGVLVAGTGVVSI